MGLHFHQKLACSLHELYWSPSSTKKTNISIKQCNKTLFFLTVIYNFFHKEFEQKLYLLYCTAQGTLDDSHRAVQALRRKWFKISAFVHAEDYEAQMKSSTDTFKLTAPKLLELTSPT